MLDARQVRTAFVAAPFSRDFDEVIGTILFPGVLSAGLRPVRFARSRDERRALNRIGNRIRSADVVVALVTGRNAHVFLELGMALSLGKPAIAIANDDRDFGILGGVCACLLYGPDASSSARSLALQLGRTTREHEARLGASLTC